MFNILKFYILGFGIISIISGFAEFIFPEKTALFWKWWSSNRFYRIHGILLISAGFPLTIAEGKFSTILFITGLIVVLTGPFILIYPEKFSSNYALILNEKGEEGLKKIITLDAVLKVAVGIICIVHFIF